MSELFRDPLDISERERDVIRHALGLTRGKHAYRNFFAASPGTQDDDTWRALVDRRLAVLAPSIPAMRDYNLYHVTQIGRVAVGAGDEA